MSSPTAIDVTSTARSRDTPELAVCRQCRSDATPDRNPASNRRGRQPRGRESLRGSAESPSGTTGVLLERPMGPPQPRVGRPAGAPVDPARSGTCADCSRCRAPRWAQSKAATVSRGGLKLPDSNPIRGGSGPHWPPSAREARSGLGTGLATPRLMPHGRSACGACHRFGGGGCHSEDSHILCPTHERPEPES